MMTSDAAVLKRGEFLFNDHCYACHAQAGAPGGYPNLWNLSPGTHQIFEKIVLEGIYKNFGMASFRDVLSAEDARALHAYLIADARALREKKH